MNVAAVSQMTGEHPTVPTIELTHSSGFGAPRDLDISRELLGFVADAEPRRSFLRVYQPTPTVAFSRRESFLEGFAGDGVCQSTWIHPRDPPHGRASSFVQLVMSHS